MAALKVKAKRIYEPREASDGTRILVMRMWPRGVRKSQIDEWNRDVAPSKELVHAFKREGLSWPDYVKRYRKEIRPEAIEALRRRTGTITLLCSCADESRCHRGLLLRMLSKPRAARAAAGSRQGS